MDAAIALYPFSRRSAVLPLLHLAQSHFGHVPRPAIAWIARKLGLEPVDVLELVTFYPMLRQKPAGRFHIRVCRTLSCALAGSERLMKALCDATGIDRSALEPHHHPVVVSPDGLFSVEFAECLACCDRAPACMINDDLHPDADPARVDALLAPYRASARPA